MFEWIDSDDEEESDLAVSVDDYVNGRRDENSLSQ